MIQSLPETPEPGTQDEKQSLLSERVPAAPLASARMRSLPVVARTGICVYIIVGVEPDEPEDTSDLEKLLSGGGKTANSPRLPPKISGNDYCPCGSGKKFKKCCGAA
jgi:hypothetical protein